MAGTDLSSDIFEETPEAGTVDMKLEAVTLPVCDIDRARCRMLLGNSLGRSPNRPCRSRHSTSGSRRLVLVSLMSSTLRATVISRRQTAAQTGVSWRPAPASNPR